MYIYKMGYGFFEPCIVYGFYEKDQNEIICWDFLEEHEVDRYIKYTNKGGCFGFVYGISCNSIEEMNTIDKTNVDKVFELLSEKDEYVPPKLHRPKRKMRQTFYKKIKTLLSSSSIV